MKKLTVAQAVKSSAKYIAITNDRYGTKRIESGFSFCVGTFYDDNLNNSNINEFACSRKMFDKILSEKASEILENSDENVMAENIEELGKFVIKVEKYFLKEDVEKFKKMANAFREKWNEEHPCEKIEEEK